MCSGWNLFVLISLFFSSSFRYSHNNKLCVIMRPIFCIIDPHDFYQSLSSMKIPRVEKFYGCKAGKSFVLRRRMLWRVGLIMIFREIYYLYLFPRSKTENCLLTDELQIYVHLNVILTGFLLCHSTRTNCFPITETF